MFDLLDFICYNYYIKTILNFFERENMHNQRGQSTSQGLAGLIAGLVFLILLVAIIVGLMFGLPNYTRYQRLADETNLVQVNDIAIQQTKQLVEVEKQKAAIRVQEAIGISNSQKIINGTLTPQYLQHEAIQAQMEAAKNSSHTETIYIPSGTQGIPSVNALGVHL